MSAREGQILHGNADLVSAPGAIAEVPREVRDIEQALDRLVDTPLVVAETIWLGQLALTPLPAKPEPLP